MFNIIYNIINTIYKEFNFFFFFFFRRIIFSIPSLWIIVVLSLIIIKLTWSQTSYFISLFEFTAPFYDTGTMLSLLICLEHIYVCYYLIIILILVYWTLYIFICDFSGWTLKYKWSGVSFIFRFLLLTVSKVLWFIYFFFFELFLKFLFLIKELEFLFLIYCTHINFSADSSIPLRAIGLGFFHFKKAYFNNKNIYNIFINFAQHLDIFGRSLIILNTVVLRFLLLLNLLLDSLLLLKKRFSVIEEIQIKKNLSNFLYYNEPKIYFFSNIFDFNFFNKNHDRLNYSYNIVYLRTIFNDIFAINQFKHSGIFEAIWAIFPTSIIIGILIPSLILLYSFEDILNPQLTVKVIGNQWYWTYEFDNWVSTSYSKNKFHQWNKFNHIFNVTKPYINSEMYSRFAFNSVIVDAESLEFGTKRLLEVDNRLVLPTNATIRFLVTGSDVLHAFAVPELGFKVDAVPGRLNQIILFINRPGIYYGQCSELCGANHAFMPIVIEGVLPNVFLKYLDKTSLMWEIESYKKCL